MSSRLNQLSPHTNQEQITAATAHKKNHWCRTLSQPMKYEEQINSAIFK